MYRCKHFTIEELVGPELHKMLPEELLWRLFRPEVLQWLDRVREAFGAPIIVNDWHKGGKFKESGLRLQTTKTGALRSKHKIAEGFDLKPADPKRHRELWDLLFNRSDLGTVRIEHHEATPTWVHGEGGAVTGRRPTVFRP